MQAEVVADVFADVIPDGGVRVEWVEQAEQCPVRACLSLHIKP